MLGAGRILCILCITEMSIRSFSVTNMTVTELRVGKTVKHIVTNFDIQSVKIEDYRPHIDYGLTELFTM